MPNVRVLPAPTIAR